MSLHKIPTEASWQHPGTRSLPKVSWQNPSRISLGSLYTRSLQKIVVVPVHSAPVPFERSLEQDCCCLQVSVHDSCRRSPGRTPVQNLDQSSAGRMCIRGVVARSLYKLSCGRISVWDGSFCAHGHFTSVISRGNLKGNPGMHVRACVVEMHIDSFHKSHFAWQITCQTRIL